MFRYHRSNSLSLHSPPPPRAYLQISNAISNKKKLQKKTKQNKTGILKIHGVKKEKQVDVFIWAATRAPGRGELTQHFFSQSVILPTTEDMNLFIMVTVTPSKKRGKPPNSKLNFLLSV